nr:alpha/beta hydrolase [uncultured Flavobacterium sp.]
MKYSVQYYITSFYINIKGIKKLFSNSPVNFRKIRKEDIHNPSTKFFKRPNIIKFRIADSDITEINKEINVKKLLIFVPGGAFISGPIKIHWNIVEKLSKKTLQNIWLCDYPKAPEHDILNISNNLDSIYKKALEKYDAENITFIGDSAGATLIMALTQRAIANKWNIPKKLVLVCPVCDATFQNPEITTIEKKDFILATKGVISAKKMCAGKHELDNVMMSPIYAPFTQFPKTILFLAENDITYADQKLLVKRLNIDSISHKVYLGVGMPHIWPYLPFMPESKRALQNIIGEINQS